MTQSDAQSKTTPQAAAPVVQHIVLIPAPSLPEAPLNLSPVSLEGRVIRLEPLSLDHLDGLCQAGLDPELWTWTPHSLLTQADMEQYIQAALDSQAKGQALPFVIIDKATGKVIGSTRFYNIDAANRGVEIGQTWIGRQWQGTAVSAERFLLMLQHAFDSMGCIRVQLKADVLNTASRRSIEGTGAKLEGIIRNHMIMPDGRVRDSVYYSILKAEWPEAKAAIEARVALRAAGPNQ